MRIISGSARGTKLESLEGLDTRPTLDRVKEAVFSSITPYLYGADVLDLFAGSGALGLESLSRGANRCDFVDKNIDCKSIIQKNIDKTHFSDKCNVYICDFEKYIKSCNSKYDVVFLDPPYAMGRMGEIIESIGSITSDDAVVVAEVLAGTVFNHKGFEILKEKTYGKVGIFILGKEQK